MLVDAFLYFDEKELVELRIKYLNDLVDHFIVVEADVTHQGKKKDWNFEPLLKNNLKNFSQKIHYHKLKIDMNEADSERGWIYEKVKGGRSWKIENMQRNYIKEACKDFAAKDIIIISDLDEIPSREKIKFIKSCDFQFIAPVAFEHFLFHLDCNHLNLEKWLGSIAVTKEIFDKSKPQELRNNRYKISQFVRSGWSFSSFGGLNRVREKFEAFAHEEYNKEEFKNDEHLIKCMENGEDVFKRNTKKQKVKRDFFPKDLLKIMEENPKFYFGTGTAI
mgnify:CR=1 FL=1